MSLSSPSSLLRALLGFSVAGSGAQAATFYREASSYSTKCDPDPPKYAGPADASSWGLLNEFKWLDVGLDYRFRYEYRDDDIRRARDGVDEPLLHRTRLYLGVHDLIDPLRFAVELQDSHRYNSAYALDNRDVNELEIIRLYAELHFKDLLPADAHGNSRPVALRFGNHNFEFLDRRLIGNNQWRNTANAFRGWHGILGQEANDWQLDLLSVQPLDRLLYDPDRPADGKRLWAAIGSWRRWSDVVTLEPFYLRLDEWNVADGGRVVHSPGLRAYGLFGKSGFDFDASGITQFGHNGSKDISAWAANAEIGYRFDDAWKSRLSFFYGAASGDRSPTDGEDNRFERFFGFGRPWSANDYVVFENILAPKVRYEATVSPTLRFDAGYSWYSLQSATDRFYNAANNRDQTGQSGTNVGHEFDIRFRWQVTRQAEVTVGYAHFVAGEWTRRLVRPDDTDFAYLELSLKPF
jgi:hypothetical protein